MQNDKTTLKDLSVFTSDGTGSVFALIDRTTTSNGRDQLRHHIQHPPASFEHLCRLQEVIKFWSAHTDLWPAIISNGTLVMLEKFYESADNVASPPTGFVLLLNTFFQKLLNKREYFFTSFSISHLSDFLKGCRLLADIAELPDVPPLLKAELETIKEELKHRLTEEVTGVTKQTNYTDISRLNFRARREMKNMVYRLMGSYSRLDAWQSMARATIEHKWVFPELLPELPICFEMKQLYHPLLEHPVSYDMGFDHNRNFLVLTGANMSGKTTYMRALGIGALLAHLGMGVPARRLRISFLNGIITNMQVEDNILRGESYFFAEVKRMKLTAEQIQQDKPNLVLMDELFKGTNVHDAYECTRAVVEGLLNYNNHLMILSTHLYEVAHHFSSNKDILFAHFVTAAAGDGSFHFSYELKPGISNDRIGYKILQKEGVIALLEKGGGKRE